MDVDWVVRVFLSSLSLFWFPTAALTGAGIAGLMDPGRGGFWREHEQKKLWRQALSPAFPLPAHISPFPVELEESGMADNDQPFDELDAAERGLLSYSQ